MSVAAGEPPVTALVIDDEVMVRQLVRRMLEPDVCRVVEADNGELGLRLVERHRGTIDLVLTDLVMPGIDGYDILRVLATHCPDLPVACMSGYARNVDREGGILVPFIPKPFTTESLRGALGPLLVESRRLRRGAYAGDGRATGRELGEGAEEAHAMAENLVAAALSLRQQRRGQAPM